MLSLAAFLAGLAICLGLIISIGAQNSYVLRQGIRREHVGAIVIACIASEVVLQTAGVAGVGVLVEHVPWLDGVARWAGAIFLVGYALVCARRAWRGGGSLVEAPADADASAGAGGAGGTGVALRQRTSRRTAVLTILALTWLNPHALIETTLVMGSIAATHGDARWSFLVGGLVASAIWFVGFGYGARFLAPIMRTERAWRILDAGIAVVMLGIAVALVAL
ncbi:MULTISPECIES: LysE/ArgO family amino acid transporter [unclassified Agrococcus]|uniref:LysE/ArgO family amino acid transporter n=1 Tax=unclassified Agrococcus TaxID=2615065 RepID=UPI00360A9AD2